MAGTVMHATHTHADEVNSSTTFVFEIWLFSKMHKLWMNIFEMFREEYPVVIVMWSWIGKKTSILFLGCWKTIFGGQPCFWVVHSWSRSYQTFIFPVFRFLLLSLSVCNKGKNMYSWEMVKLISEKQKNSPFLKKKSLVRLNPGLKFEGHNDRERN